MLQKQQQIICQYNHYTDVYQQEIYALILDIRDTYFHVKYTSTITTMIVAIENKYLKHTLS